MKDLRVFIRESIEWETPKTENGWGVVTVVRRENLDLANISEEDFIKFMLEDYNKAVEEYTKICKPLNDKKIQSHIEYTVNRAIQYAEKKWKTQKKRDEYVENIRKNASEQQIFLEDPKKIFFDLKPDSGMGIRQECIINANTTEKTLKTVYELMQTSKFFKRGTGWAFKYEAKTKDSAYSFRPYIDILLNESDRAEQKRDEDTLTKAVMNFYSDSNYWGD